jgi:predicted acyl esterase
MFTRKDRGMIIEYDLPIVMDDGVVLRADVFRPEKEGKYPVILSYGPYGKNLHFEDGYPDQWNKLIRENPEVLEGSSGKYMNWETTDPERWVSEGYVIVRVDSRGAGRSEGFLYPHSPREIKDLYNCIEWAASQPWSNGNVGLLGISYYATNQWAVASLNPPHLKAIIPWEGANDYYREQSYHGGILSSNFRKIWYEKQVIRVQHGVGERGFRDRNTGELVSGPETLPEEELKRRRVDLMEEIKKHPLDDEFHKSRSAKLENIRVPLLSCGNWGGLGLHLRGNVEGFLRAPSENKWLEIHGREHWTEFYTKYGLALQKKFFDYYLKGIDNGWKNTPRVILWIRRADGSYFIRAENEFPIARTKWTKLFLNPNQLKLEEGLNEGGGEIEYEALGPGITFLSEPLKEETEITGPVALKLFISSSTKDADIFAVLRAFSPDMREVYFNDYMDPHTPVSMGWLRASHRKKDPKLSLEYRPFHTHDEVQYLEPNRIYELDVEIWPTSIVLPKGYRIGLTIRGKDFEYCGDPVKIGFYVMRGSGPFLHEERDPEIYGGKVKVYSSKEKPSYLLLPIIPPKKEDRETEKIKWLISLKK